jgi:hypothetical protein
MKFKKYKYNPTRKILVPFRTTKVCSFTWNLDNYSFVQIVFIKLWWYSGKVFNSDAGGQSSNPSCEIFIYILTMTLLGAPVQSRAQASYLFLSSSWDYISPYDFRNIWINFGDEFWLILCQEYINSKLFAVSTYLWRFILTSIDGLVTNFLLQIQGAWVRI